MMKTASTVNYSNKTYDEKGYEQIDTISKRTTEIHRNHQTITTRHIDKSTEASTDVDDSGDQIYHTSDTDGDQPSHYAVTQNDTFVNLSDVSQEKSNRSHNVVITEDERSSSEEEGEDENENDDSEEEAEEEEKEMGCVTNLALLASGIDFESVATLKDAEESDSYASSEDNTLEEPEDSAESPEMTEEWKINPGELVDIKGRLGKGATATVYRGVLHNRHVAVKQIELSKFSEGLKHAQMVTQREFDIVRSLNHRNIIKFYDLFYNKAEQQVNIVMELVQGVPITDLVLYKKMLAEQQASYILYHVLTAIQYLHSNWILHRDLKPDNVLINMEAQIKLIDFGTATTVNPSEEAKRRSTVGTPWYCAPEVLNSEQYGSSCDVWSIGCFAIELVSGKPPFDDLNDIACMIKMAEGVPPPLPPDISNSCQDFLTKCLIPDWKERPSTSELLADPFLTHYKQKHEKIEEQLKMIVQQMRQVKLLQSNLKHNSVVNIKL